MYPTGSNRIGKHLAVLLLSALMMALFAPSVKSQDNPSGFQIGQPRYFLGAHAGMNFPNAASDLFEMVTRELTLEKRDFRSPAFGFDFGVALKSNYALVFAWEYSTVSSASESRPYVDQNGNPIVQTTWFKQMPILATFRYYPMKTGEKVGSYAWVPARFSPYIAGGGGFMRYSFRQEGSFVNANTLDIFDADLRSKGYAPVGHFAAGFDINITSRFFANFEARYIFSEKQLTDDFIGFEPIDLKGLRANGGIFVRF